MGISVRYMNNCGSDLRMCSQESDADLLRTCCQEKREPRKQDAEEEEARPGPSFHLIPRSSGMEAPPSSFPLLRARSWAFIFLYHSWLRVSMGDLKPQVLLAPSDCWQSNSGLQSVTGRQISISNHLIMPEIL